MCFITQVTHLFFRIVRGANLEARNQNGATSLHLAAEIDGVEAVLTLIRLYAPVVVDWVGYLV